MGFLDKKQPQPEMEVIEDELEAAEEKLEEVRREREVEVSKIEEKEQEEVEIMVVKKEDIPMQEVRLITREDGSKVQLMTTEEALSKVMNS